MPLRSAERSLKRIRKLGFLTAESRLQELLPHSIPYAISGRGPVAVPVSQDGGHTDSHDGIPAQADRQLTGSSRHRDGKHTDTHDGYMNTKKKMNTYYAGDLDDAAVRKQSIRRLITAYAEVKPADIDTTIPGRWLSSIAAWTNGTWRRSSWPSKPTRCCGSENKEERYRLGAANFFEVVESYVAANIASRAAIHPPDA